LVRGAHAPRVTISTPSPKSQRAFHSLFPAPNRGCASKWVP
jgi:hypothetical protein